MENKKKRTKTTRTKKTAASKETKPKTAKAAETKTAEKKAHKTADVAKKIKTEKKKTAGVKEVKAIARFVPTPPRKIRYVMDTIRGKKVSDALTVLKFTPNFAAAKIEKVLKSAVANAENNFKMDVDKLYISKAYADPGPTQKRYLPRAMGRASLIFKRSSHITISVMEQGG